MRTGPLDQYQIGRKKSPQSQGLLCVCVCVCVCGMWRWGGQKPVTYSSSGETHIEDTSHETKYTQNQDPL